MDLDLPYVSKQLSQGSSFHATFELALQGRKDLYPVLRNPEGSVGVRRY